MILSQISLVKKPKQLKPKVYILRLSNIVNHLKNLKSSSYFLKSFSRDLKRQSSIVKIIKNFDSDLNTGVSLFKNHLLQKYKFQPSISVFSPFCSVYYCL